MSNPKCQPAWMRHDSISCHFQSLTSPYFEQRSGNGDHLLSWKTTQRVGVWDTRTYMPGWSCRGWTWRTQREELEAAAEENERETRTQEQWAFSKASRTIHLLKYTHPCQHSATLTGLSHMNSGSPDSWDSICTGSRQNSIQAWRKP